MTKNDRPAFATCVGLMAETLNQPLSELTLEGLFFALQDLPLDALQQAAGQWVREHVWLPKPAEWRELVNEQAAKALDQVQLQADPYCYDCDDTGWQTLYVGDVRCARPCPCRGRNPRYLKQRRDSYAGRGVSVPLIGLPDAKRIEQKARDWKAVGAGDGNDE